YIKPKCLATIREIVLFPAPAGPSMAILILRFPILNTDPLSVANKKAGKACRRQNYNIILVFMQNRAVLRPLSFSEIQLSLKTITDHFLALNIRNICIADHGNLRSAFQLLHANN